MRFKYKAYTPTKRIVESEIEASSVKEVLEFLTNKGLVPINLAPIKEIKGIKGFFKKASRISTIDKIWLAKYLALMLRTGTDLLSAVKILKADYEKPALKNFLQEVQINLEKGRPFYFSFSKYENVFGPVFVNLVRAGEESGNLAEIFDRLSISLQREEEFTRGTKSALVYPVLLLSLSVAIIFFLSMFAIPKISSVFQGMGKEPPIFSKIVFSFGNFVSNYGVFIIIFLIALLIGIFLGYKKSDVFRKFLYNLIIKIGIVRDLLKKIAITRFASTLSSLIRAGISLPKGLEITAPAVGNDELKETLLRISRQGLKKGLTISESFARESFFPRSVVSLISIAERTGQLEQTLSTIAVFYEKEVNSTLKNLLSVLEPVLLLIMGLIVGAIALATIVPIYQMVKQV